MATARQPNSRSELKEELQYDATKADLEFRVALLRLAGMSSVAAIIELSG